MPKVHWEVMDFTHLVQSGGLLMVSLLVFGESALFLGMVLPGDTLLISVGILAAQGKLPLEFSIIVIAVAAILGDNVGYQTGRVMGKRLFHKKESVIFRQEYLLRAEKFYEKHGSKTMLLSHFVPFVRSFAPMLAGVAKMPWFKFFTYVVIGDTVWAVVVTLLGYWFGSRIPNLDHYILPVLGAVIILSFGPTVWHLFGDAETRHRLFTKFKRRRPKDTTDSE